ncbi:hypothetical protein OHB26_13930 [Nocardia sp. NBC_01503]|uniref:hypothetical protein n=1 Tax=Nocardia sp. NBC_01503 TaxID=2975997 RepID=UPI002E7AD15B|nr:hypothetical protein [Nocardia sp. NBC_01503]WTL35195.1 hypothetical protein OHB26_13930 [Nocardia sp. NBC_01503]
MKTEHPTPVAPVRLPRARALACGILAAGAVALQPGETLNSVLPDSNGLLWFVAKNNGVVGTLDPETGATQVIRLGSGADGEIENSFAVGNDGDVYIATNRELLRFDSGPGGTPDITWRVTYANSGQRTPGQVDDGLDRPGLPHRKPGVATPIRLRPPLRQQLRGPGPRPRRHRLPGRPRRPQLPARRGVAAHI